MKDEISFEKNDNLGNSKQYHAYGKPAIIVGFALGAAMILSITKAAPKATIVAIIILGVLAAFALSVSQNKDENNLIDS
jgi:predicted esterase